MLAILHGDCVEQMRAMEAESFDACVTDPPYGIGFMGKQWDTFKPDALPPATANRGDSDNPNVRGRKRSPAASPSSVSYDESLSGHRKFQAWTEAWAREVYRVLKPGAFLLCSGAPRSYHRAACGIEDAGFDVRDCINWIFGQGFPKSHNLEDDWEGWGTALKPAWEPVIMARKPLIGTVAANVARFGTGALNIAACRVGTADTRNVKKGGANDFPHEDDSWKPRSVEVGSACGRWPANVIHDGSEEVQLAFAQFGENKGAVAPVTRRGSDKFRGCYGKFEGQSEAGATFHADTGTALRFFYCAKASRTDRNEGLDGFEEKPLLWSAGTQNPGSFQSEGTHKAARNHHPTVKPVDLMRYLCRLVTPPGGTVLDPFAGSGSTGKAAKREGFNFVGIEREAEYVEIARARIAA